MRRIILVGIGHTNAHILRQWKRKPIPDAELVCVSNFPTATYSGMLPDVVIGGTPESGMRIDLTQLCKQARARLILDDIIGLDVERSVLRFSQHEPVQFDAMSIGIGSVPTFGRVDPLADGLVTIKPMQEFLGKFDAEVQALVEQEHQLPLRLSVVGGGVASIELIACLPYRVKELTDHRVEFALVSGNQDIPAGFNPKIRNQILQKLRQRGVTLHLGRRVNKVENRKIWLDQDKAIDSDLTVWATNAAPPDLISELNLPVDGKGFLETDKSLRSISGAPIFIVGDTGSIAGLDVPKSGVFAVRQGPVLWKNLQRLLQGQPLVEFEPQRTFMKLINMGDGTAIGQWRGLSMNGRWVMRLKRAIDNQFMKKYTTGF